MEIEEENNNTKKIIVPTEEQKNTILFQFGKDLSYICKSKQQIFEMSKSACNYYYSYRDYIFPDLLQEILEQAGKRKRLEYLYLLIEIIKYLNSNKYKYPIKSDLLFNIFPFVKEITRCFYYSFNNDFTKLLKVALNELKKHNIYPSNYIDDLIMELRLTTESNIGNNIKDRNSLSNLINNNILKIDYEMINLYKNFDDLKRTNNNKIRLELIKRENNMIEKQIKIYNENLKQLKCINELINICDNIK